MPAFLRACALLALALLSSPAPASPALVRGPSSLVYPDFWHTPLGLHRGTPQLLQLMLGDVVRFSDPQGVATTRMDEYGENSPQITAFGVNSGSGQIVYNPNMRSLAVFGRQGSGVGEFDHPVGVACLPNGRVAVADSGNHRIVLLQFKDGVLSWQGTLGSQGKAKGLFDQPRWVALDSQGRLYVSDTGNNRIQVFSQEGTFLFSFGSDPRANNFLLEPQSIAVVDPLEPHGAEHTGAIYVVDQYHGRIQKFDLSGRFQAQALATDFDKYLVYFNGLALDYYNNLWVADRGNHQIHKFDSHLQYVDSWGRQGEGDGLLNSPRGVAIYRLFGQVLVLERDSAQYLWIGADIKDIKFNRVHDATGTLLLRIDYRLTERAVIDSWIEDADGEKVAYLLKRRKQKQGQQSVFWDGNFANGARVVPGTYQLVFQAEAAYSSSTYFKRDLRKKFVVR